VAWTRQREQRCKRVSLNATEPLQRPIYFYEKNEFRLSSRIGDFLGMPLFEYISAGMTIPLLRSTTFFDTHAPEVLLILTSEQRGCYSIEVLSKRTDGTGYALSSVHI
jgi:hypothetical protein